MSAGDPISLWVPVIGAGAACLATLSLTPLARRLARRWDVMDKPGPLKVQTSPIPYLGGLAIYGGLFAGLGLASAFHPSLTLRWLSGFLLGGIGVAAAGLWDDLHSLSPYARLAVEGLAGGLFVWGIQAPWPLAIPLVLFFWVGCNAVNLIDGQDGLAAGVGALFGCGALLLGISEGDPGMALLGAALLGACVGFLKFNWNPANILMGDCGSLLLGFWIAAIAVYWILGRPSPQRVAQMTLLFAFPLVDMALAVLRRVARRKNAFEGDRDHLYDVLARTRLGTAGSTTLCLTVAGLVASLALSLQP